MVRVYEVEYEVDVKSEVQKKREEIVKTTGKLWEHAVSNPIFKYELPEGDFEKARAVANIMQLLNGKVAMIKKKQIIKEVV